MIKWIISLLLYVLQIVLAFALLKIPFIVQIFAYLSEGVTALQLATQEGAEFVFGYLNDKIKIETDGRAWVHKVQCWEHGENMAEYRA